MTRIPILVWGCGRIARMFHLRHLVAHPNVDLVGLADADDRNVQEAASLAPGAALFTDYRASLGAKAAGVVICLPPAMHAEAAEAAFGSGYAVYLEKPLATGLEEGRSVLQARAKSGGLGVMGFNFRFHPRFEELRRRIGELGALRGAQSTFTSSSRVLPDWKRRRRTGGGVLLDLGSHHADLAQHLFDADVEQVSASQSSIEVEHDNASMSLTLSNGVCVQSWFSMNAIQSHRWVIFGRDGRATIDLEDPLRLQIKDGSWAGARARRILSRVRALAPRELLLRPGWEPSFGRSLDAFVSAVGGGALAPQAATLEDGYRSLEVVVAAEASATSGRVEPVGRA